jgi:putative addiction module antidote
MYTIKVRKVGNSLGVVLPREALAKLKVGDGETVYLTESDDGFRVTPMNETFARQMKAAETIMREDRDLLRELFQR